MQRSREADTRRWPRLGPGGSSIPAEYSGHSCLHSAYSPLSSAAYLLGPPPAARWGEWPNCTARSNATGVQHN